MFASHTVVLFMHPATTQKVVYGAKSEVAAAAGLNGTLPDVFIEYYQKSGIEMRQAEGDETRRIAEFRPANGAKGEVSEEVMCWTRQDGGWLLLLVTCGSQRNGVISKFLLPVERSDSDIGINSLFPVMLGSSHPDQQTTDPARDAQEKKREGV